MRMAWIALATIVAGGAWGQSQPPTPTPTPTKTSHEPQRQTENKDDKTNELSRPPSQQLPVAGTAPPSIYVKTANQQPHADSNSSAEWWSIAVSLALFVVAFLQWRTYRRQAEIMDSQTNIARVQNRASIFLKTLRLEPSNWENGNPVAWRVIATLENSGTTPPRCLRYTMFGVVIPSESVRTLRFEPMHETAKSGFVGPKSSIDIHAADVHEVGPGKKTLVWGWVEYDDVFEPSDRHRTEFCFEFGTGALVDLDDGDTTLLPEFLMHERHNGMDGDCMHKAQRCAT
jgi:hypothetical protein